jgi:hypothetical protein
VQWSPSPTASTDPWHLHPDGAKTRLYLARRKGAIPDHRWAALGIVAVRLVCEKQRDGCLNRVGQESWRALTYHRCEGSRSGARWMWKGNDSIWLPGVATPSRKGVTLPITQDTPLWPSSTTFEHNSVRHDS